MFEKKTQQKCTCANDPVLCQFVRATVATACRFSIKSIQRNEQRNVVNREKKLAIGEDLQTLLHPIVSATKQAAEKTAGELAPVKKALEDIDGTLKAQRRAAIPQTPPSPPEKDLTFGIHATGDGRNATGNSIVYI